MNIKARLARTVAVTSLAVSGAVAVAPAVSAAPKGPGELTIPTHCTHGCDGVGGGAIERPGDLTVPLPGPAVDPQPDPTVRPDRPILVTQPTFTG